MKALVVEIRGGKAAALREDGTVVLIRKGNLAVGDTVNIDAGASRRSRRKIWRAVTAAAAAFAVVSVGGIYRYSAVQACSYVSVDLGSSLEYVLNRQNRVLTVEAVDEDAEEFAAELRQEVKNKSLSEALEAASDLLEQQNLLTEDEDYVLINVTSESEDRTAFLTKAAENFFAGSEDVTLVVTEATMEERATARDLGISTGKFKEMETIERQNNGDFAPDRAMTDSYRDMPVKDFMRMAGQIPEEPNPAGAPSGQTAPGPAGKSQTSGGEQAAGQNQGQTTGETQPAGQGKAAGGNQPAGKSQTSGGEQAAGQNQGQTTGGAQPAGQNQGQTTGGTQPAGQGQAAGGNRSAGQGQAATGNQPGSQNQTAGDQPSVGAASAGQEQISDQAQTEDRIPAAGQSNPADYGQETGQNQAGGDLKAGQSEQGQRSPEQNPAPAFQNQAPAGAPQGAPGMGR